MEKPLRELYPLHPDLPAYIMGMEAEIKRLEDLILRQAVFDDELLEESLKIRERRKNG